MIRLSDWPLLGLKEPTRGGPAAHLVPTSGAAQPFREMGELFPDWAARPARLLTVGVDCSLHWGSARKLLAAFRAAYPDVLLQIKDADEAQLVDDLKTRRIDAAIAPYLPVRREWRIMSLWRERLIAVTAEGNPLAGANAVSPGQLRDQVIMLAGNAISQRSITRAIVTALEGPPLAFVHHPVERDTLFDLVALGLGLTISPGGTLGAFYPGVCLCPIASKAAEIAYGLTWVAENNNPALRDFLSVADAVVSRGAATDGPA